MIELSNNFLYTLAHFFSKNKSTSGLVMEGKDGEMIWEMILSRKFSSLIFSFKNLRFCAVKLLQKYVSISTKSKQELKSLTRLLFK